MLSCEAGLRQIDADFRGTNIKNCENWRNENKKALYEYLNLLGCTVFAQERAAIERKTLVGGKGTPKNKTK